MTRAECTGPTWANLVFVDGDRMIWSSSVGFHGLPRVGEMVEYGDHCGDVSCVQWAPVTNPGELKATVFVQVRR